MRQERLNLHIYPSPFKSESRILKETRSILSFGVADRIEVIASWEPGLKEREAIDAGRSVWRVMLTMKRFPKVLVVELLKYLELIWRVVANYWGKPIFMVNCHSTSVLPLGVILKLIKRCTLVYDTHELETERNGLRGARKLCAKIVERALMPFVDKIVVTSDSYGAWYKSAYPVKEIHVVKNVPYAADFPSGSTTVLRDHFKIPKDSLIFIYQGLIGPGRGVQMMLDAFSSAELADKHIVFMGYGELDPLVKEYASRVPTIHYHPAVPIGEILRYTGSADVGLSLIERTCLSYYYTLPNKVYESILSGIPVVVSNFPDMGAVVDAYGVGWKVEVTQEAFTACIASITAAEVRKKRENCEAVRGQFGWHVEEQKLKAVYRDVA